MDMQDFAILKTQNDEAKKRLLCAACTVSELVSEGREVNGDAIAEYLRAKEIYNTTRRDLEYAFELECKELINA